jgi:uncharacterized membrane protein YccC
MLGVRTALATVLPLVASPGIGPSAAAWASIGGFTVALADKGGSYRTRAQTMGGVTLAATLSVTVGALAAAHSWIAVPLMLVWATTCAFAAVFGPAAAAGGTTVAVLFAVSLASPAPTPRLALERGLAILGGGGGAMALALFFWPVRVYKPARYAVARSFRALAAHVRALHPSTTAVHGHAAIRDAIEAARGVLAATRRGRSGESGRGARLLVLLQLADRMFAAVIALEEVLESLTTADAPAPLVDEARRALAGLAASLEELAGRIETERKLPAPPAFDWGPDGVRAAAAGHAAALSPARRADAEHAAALLARLRGFAELSFDTAGTLYDQRPTAETPPAALDRDGPRLGELLRDNLSRDSVLLRHALRVGVSAAAAVAATRAIGLGRGYWVTLTVIILLQPYTPATSLKTLQRVAGTVAGGILAAVLVAKLHDARLVLVVAALLAGVSAAIVQLNYALFSFFLTPTFILLADAHARDWHLAELRIVNTLLGGALAFAGSRLLWPHDEQRRFPEEMARALGALRDYFAEVMHVVIEGVPPPAPSLPPLRRRFGLAMNAAEASFQRLVAEPGGEPAALEPLMTLLLFARRFGATVNAFASARTVTPTQPYAATLTAFAREVEVVLDDLEAAIRAGRPPAPLAPLDDAVAAVESTPIAARLGRLAGQLAVLHEAAARAAVPRGANGR